MKKIWKGALLLSTFAVAAVFGITVSSEAEGGVTATKDDCMSAWAVLAPGDAKPAVEGVVRWRTYWKSDSYERGVSQSFDLQIFGVVGGGDAVVAHCGHGATCNELARAVNRAYPNLSNPVVFCTVDPPAMLTTK